MTSYNFVQRFSAISEEYRAVYAVLAYTEREWQNIQAEPELLKVNLPIVRTAQSNLDATYILRAFVQFEALLREYLTARFPTQSVPYKTEALINRVAKRTRPNIPDDVRDKAHDVRNYRNNIVHSNPGSVVQLEFRIAFRDLVTFLYWLPDPP